MREDSDLNVDDEKEKDLRESIEKYLRGEMELSDIKDLITKNNVKDFMFLNVVRNLARDSSEISKMNLKLIEKALIILEKELERTDSQERRDKLIEDIMRLLEKAERESNSIKIFIIGVIILLALSLGSITVYAVKEILKGIMDKDEMLENSLNDYNDK